MTDNVTVLPHDFIDKHLANSNHTEALVYIIGLRYSENGLLTPDNAAIAEILRVRESDVESAWQYWQHQGLITLADGQVTFLSHLPQALPKTPRSHSGKSLYTPAEIARCLENSSDLRLLYDEAQHILGKSLSSVDMQSLYYMYDCLRLPPEVLLLLMGNAVQSERTNMRYIEKVAVTWSELGIDNLQKAEAYLAELEDKRTFEYKVKGILGISGRDFTKTERAAVEDWQTRIKPSKELIELAFDICVKNTGKLSIKYMNGVLENWHDKGVTTVEQAEALQQKQPVSQPKTKAKTTAFTNFDQREYDYDSMEKALLLRRKKDKS